MSRLTSYDKSLLAMFAEEHWALFVDHICNQTNEAMTEADAERIVEALNEEADQ